MKGKMASIILAIVVIVAIVATVSVTVWIPQVAPAYSLIFSVALVAVTAIYAYLTSRMVNEMKEQRLAATKPVIIQKPVHRISEGIETSYFSHFLVCNIGNGTAIEPVIVLRNENKGLIQYERKSFMKPGEEVTFKPGIVLTASKYYLDCVYMDMSHITGVKSVHRTRLPFRIDKASVQEESYVIRDEQSFDFNVSENEVQDVLPSDSSLK
jgi:hypothetical protein